MSEHCVIRVSSQRSTLQGQSNLASKKADESNIVIETVQRDSAPEVPTGYWYTALPIEATVGMFGAPIEADSLVRYRTLADALKGVTPPCVLMRAAFLLRRGRYEQAGIDRVVAVIINPVTGVWDVQQTIGDVVLTGDKGVIGSVISGSETKVFRQRKPILDKYEEGLRLFAGQKDLAKRWVSMSTDLKFGPELELEKARTLLDSGSLVRMGLGLADVKPPKINHKPQTLELAGIEYVVEENENAM